MLGLALAQLGRLEEAERRYRYVLEFDPGNQGASVELGTMLQRRGRFKEAVRILREGLDRHTESVALANNLAWILATAPVAEIRGGAEAVRLAEEASQRAPEQDPGMLDTLAAAYGEAGRFDEAIATARQAHELAESMGLADLAAEIRARLELYEARQPYHEQP